MTVRATTAPIALTMKASPRHQPRQANPWHSSMRKAVDTRPAPSPMPAWARPFRTEEIGENGPVPAPQADCETLDHNKCKSPNTRAGQNAARLFATIPDHRPSRDEERQRDRREPPGSAGPGEPERCTCSLRRMADDPVIPIRVGEQMPWQESEAGPAEHKPYAGGRGHRVHAWLGRATLFRQTPHPRCPTWSAGACARSRSRT